MKGKMKSMLASAALCLGATVVNTAQAETYYWVGEDYGLFGEPTNWRIGSAEGETPSTCPGKSDKLFGQQNKKIDLGGNTYEISGWGIDDDHNWNRYITNLKNGTLIATGSIYTHSGDVTLTDGANLIINCLFRPAVWDGSAHRVYINDGCDYQILGHFNNYKIELYCYAGGHFLFNPTRYSIYGSSAQNSKFYITGTMDALNGVNWTSAGLSSDSNYQLFQINDGGLMRLGAGFNRNNQKGQLQVQWNGGTIASTGTVDFVQTECAIAENASVTADVAEEASLDLTPFTVGEGVTLAKTGAGVATLPTATFAAINLQAGTLKFAATNTTVTSLAAADGATIDIGAAGLTISSATIDGTLNATVSGIFAVGDVILTSDSAELLTAVQASLQTAGVSTTLEGTTLKMAASELVFNSTTITDLNNPLGWKNYSVPSAGQSVFIAGEGVTADITGEIPAFGSITVKDGATLKVSTTETFAMLPTTLESTGKLVIAGAASLTAGNLTCQQVDEAVPTIEVSGTLAVPANFNFSHANMTVTGTIVGSGAMTFGYAAADDATAVFGLTVDGGTLRTTAGGIHFFCVDNGGAVTPIGQIVLKDATLDMAGGASFGNFGVNNPTSIAVPILFDNTTLTYPATSTSAKITGGVILDFENGGKLYRANAQNSNADLTVSGLATIIFGSGTSSLYGESSSGGSVGNGYFSLSPDEDGHTSLVLSNATWETYHCTGNNKAVVEVWGDSTRTIYQNNWNRTIPFNKCKAVLLHKDAALSIDMTAATATTLSQTFTGEGSLKLINSKPSSARTYTLAGTANTATGRLEADDEANAALVINGGATWAGTVDWNTTTSLEDLGSVTAGTWTFGGFELNKAFPLRIWADKSDVYTFTGSAFTGTSGVQIFIQDGTDPLATMSWIVATMPAESAVPTAIGNWLFSTAPVAGDETRVNLVLKPIIKDYTFNSDKTTDLSDPKGWSCGFVPVGEEVSISGLGVVASATSAIPAFASIAVKNGATLKVKGTETTLPPLKFDATASLYIGDGETKTSVTLPENFVTMSKVEGEIVTMSHVEVATNATIVVPGGIKFKNVDFELYGTVTKASTDGVGPIFGYADNGETSYVKLVADGATFAIHSSQSADNGKIGFANPVSGGRVKVLDDILIRNCKFTVDSWADFGLRIFGQNNPTDEPFTVVLDKTTLNVSWSFIAGGAAHVKLINGSSIDKHWQCRGHGFDNYVQDAATVTCDEEGTSFDYCGNYNYLRINSSAVQDAVTIRNGGIYAALYAGGTAKGVLVSSNGIVAVNKRTDHSFDGTMLNGFGSVRVESASVLAIASKNVGQTGNPGWGKDWNRAIKIADIPFTGSGDVVVTNGVPSYPFSVTIQNGANTCMGTIGLSTQTEGAKETSLVFNNGANWAGTVGGLGVITLTNLTEAASAAEVTFGKLGFDEGGAVKLRVWKDEDGAITANDKINLTDVGSTGMIALDMQDGAILGLGESFVLGTAPKGAWANVAVKCGKSTLAIRETDIGEGLVTCTARYESGMMIIVK